MQTVPVLSRDEMERRRLAAAQELMSGRSQASVAREFGVSRTTASRWQKALTGNGIETLRKRRATGRPNRLTALQRAEIVEMFADGPKAMGIEGDRWTTARLAQAIERRFGVHYDPDHVGRIMYRLGLRRRDRHSGTAPGAYVYAAQAPFGIGELSPTVQ